MAVMPTGTLTLLFTDIEGSTRLLQRLGSDSYADLLGEHHRIIRAAISGCSGLEVTTEGDAFFAIFSRPLDGLSAAVQAQRDLAAASWPEGAEVRVRMGLHTGDVQISAGEYVGLDVHRAARISGAGHGGQVLMSATTARLVESMLPADVTLLDLGEHRLKDIDAPEHLLQVVIEGLPAEFPPPRAATTRLDLLPPELSSFVGRAEVIERGRGLLSGTRLLTLTGPGGTGKTRLSLRLARDVAAEYRDGVAFVELAPIDDPDLVMTTIRERLGLAEQPGQSPLETLIDFLADRNVLLVLDNFEQIAAAAGQVAQLLEGATQVKVIATSRVALHLTGEQEFAVPPLAVPASGGDLQQISESEAVALFIQRAQAVRPDFTLTAENAPLVVGICARLDGLPLAIELAASRIKLLPLQALLERLEHSLDLLQSSSADRTGRQRTLRGAISWSYELLSEAERAIFRRCSIFIGGWQLEDAARIVEAAGAVELDLFDGTAALLDHSLVRRVDTEHDHVRLDMLETIREFGRERLVADNELERVAEAHARRFAELAAEAEPALTFGPEWPDRLEHEHANIRAALAWLGGNDLELALLTAGRLWRFWHLRGHLREGAQLLNQLLAMPGTAEVPAARTKALIGLAGLVYWQSDYALARTSYEEALSLARRLSDQQLEVDALYSLAYVRAIERDWEGANRDLRAAEALYEEQGNKVMAAWALESIGMNATLRGDHRAALPLLEQGKRRFEELGDSFGLRNSLAVESRALMNLGRLEAARELNIRVLEMSAAEQDPTSLSAAFHDAASLAALDGNLEKAAILTGTAQRIVDESGAQPPPELVNRIEATPVLERELEPARLADLLVNGRDLTVQGAIELARRA